MTWFRAWTGSRSAWYYTDASEKFSVAAKSSEGESVVEELVEKASRMLSRRQRGSGVAEMIAASPDLFAIPGVGPRNLKKLVDKGIGGVAELKRIYKDKFFGKSSEKMVLGEVCRILEISSSLYN